MTRRTVSRRVGPIGAAVIALVFGVGASCVWWAESANAARQDDSLSRADASQILKAATSFRTQHDDGCPTISLLKDAGTLNQDAREDDAWGNRFRVRCDGDTVSVNSSGHDRRANTSDDIHVSR